MATEWSIRVKPSDSIQNVLFDDQFALFDDIEINFDGISGYSTDWTVRTKPII